MNTYTIYLGGTPIASVPDIETRFAGWQVAKTIVEAAKPIAEMASKTILVVCDTTGEIIADFDPNEA